MKRNHFYVGSLMVVALALVGCQPKSGAKVASKATVEIGPKHSAKDGLSVPEETRQSLGLKVVEVTEQKVPMRLELPLRVYRTTAESSLASGTATPEQSKLLKSGQSVQVSAHDGQKLTAKITSINAELQKATGMAEVLVEIPKSSEPLAVGAFLKANIMLGAGESVVAIPRTALLEASDGFSVYTMSGDNFVRTPVKIGAMSNDLIEIKDGLYAGDQIVSQAVMSLWMTELAAVKGGQACCVEPAKGK